MSQQHKPSNYTWYESKRMLIFFENDKPQLVLSGVIAEQTKLHFEIKALEGLLVSNPDIKGNYDVIKRKDELKQRLNAIKTGKQDESN